MFNVGDRVRTKDDRTGVIVNADCRPTLIIGYHNGEREKILESELTKVKNETILISPAKFDNVVKALMYQAAEDAGDSKDLDFILEVIGMVCGQLKARLFDGN